MKAEETERLNELAQVAMDGELRMGQVVHMIKTGQLTLAKTHVDHAHQVCHRIETELEGQL